RPRWGRKRSWEKLREQLADDLRADGRGPQQRGELRTRSEVLAMDPPAEDELVLQGMLPPRQLGDRHLVPEARERERAHDVRQVRSRLAAVDGMRPEQRPRFGGRLRIVLELRGDLRL